jgi:hypothetical protein
MAKEAAFFACINKVFDDGEVIKDQRRIAKEMADRSNVRESPWQNRGKDIVSG